MKINIKLVIFSVIFGKLRVFLSDGQLPVGELKQNESLNESGKLLFKKYLPIDRRDIYYEQLYTFSSFDTKHKITVVYYFLVPEHKVYPKKENWNIEIGSDLKRAKGLTLVNKIDQEIILYAVQRLRWKIEYTNVVYSLLPDEFTFSQLQSTYEAILGKPLDKRNFRKKILALNILKSTGHQKREGRARPAEMFSFRKRELTFVKILQPSS